MKGKQSFRRVPGNVNFKSLSISNPRYLFLQKITQMFIHSCEVWESPLLKILKLSAWKTYFQDWGHENWKGLQYLHNTAAPIMTVLLQKPHKSLPKLAI